MVYSQYPSKDFCATHIVDSQICAALVFILEKCEPFRFPSFFVTDEIDVCRFSILRKYRDYIAFRKVER